MKTNLNEILTELSYRVKDGIPNLNNEQHLIKLWDVLKEFNWPIEARVELIHNLTESNKDNLLEIDDKMLKHKLKNPTTGNLNQVSTLLSKKKSDRKAYDVAKSWLGDQGVSDDDIEKAVNWLKNNSDTSAKYKAERIYLEEYRKSLKALIMKDHVDLPVSAQEREAYADSRYINHLKAMKIAIEKDEKQRFLRVSCEAKIEAWRSMSANLRSIKI